jgi:hypothetical protein
MKKILLSIGSLLFAGALLAGGTGAFLSDLQTSTGNTFASGAISLRFDNESYYTDSFGHLALSTTTTWGTTTPVTLAGHKFFNFGDIKPGDIGEDTISVHVNDNNTWACMSVKLTVSTGTTTPKYKLQNALHFAFWADDGDNVYEKGEKIFLQGTSVDIFNGASTTLADSSSNIWDEKSGGWSCDNQGNWSDDESNSTQNDPLLSGKTYYIGKAWCFGTLTPAPVAQDGKGKLPGSTNGPLKRGTGFLCNGAPLGNQYQNEGMTLNVSFYAEQARDNGTFVCAPGGKPPKGGGSDGGDGNDNSDNNYNNND